MNYERESFIQLMNVIDTLLSPNGCAWDKKQTMRTLSKQIEEEVYEFLEAIRVQDRENMVEELGDIFFLLFMTARKMEQEVDNSLIDVFDRARKKFISRHPHIFQEKKQLSEEEVIQQWQEIKKRDENNTTKKSFKSFPLFFRIKKTLEKLRKDNIVVESIENPSSEAEKIISYFWKNSKNAEEELLLALDTLENSISIDKTS